MVGKSILRWLGFTESEKLQVPDLPANPLHSEVAHKARNDATPAYGSALLSMSRSARKFKTIATELDADVRPEQMKSERERMHEALGNIMRRVGGRE